MAASRRAARRRPCPRTSYLFLLLVRTPPTSDFRPLISYLSGPSAFYTQTYAYRPSTRLQLRCRLPSPPMAHSPLRHPRPPSDRRPPLPLRRPEGRTHPPQPLHQQRRPGDRHSPPRVRPRRRRAQAPLEGRPRPPLAAPRRRNGRSPAQLRPGPPPRRPSPSARLHSLRPQAYPRRPPLPPLPLPRLPLLSPRLAPRRHHTLLVGAQHAVHP